MPDFKPNSQKTKSFLKRLELGYNVQTQKSGYLPATSDIGLSLGYKIDDRKIFGIGASYKLGWGSNIRHISFSNQGVGIRSFVDMKMKKNIWLTGGFEFNYLSDFRSLGQLYDYDTWQKSALLGLSKKYKITKNKGGNMQVLYDFLYRDHIPASPPIVFRLGFGL